MTAAADFLRLRCEPVTKRSRPDFQKTTTIPVVAEELEIETHRVVRGTVRVDKRVETHEEVVNIPAVREEIR